MAVAVAVAATGCGSDSSGQASVPTVSIPIVTSPVTPTPSAPPTTSFPGTTTTKNGGTYNPKLPDSATNDVPPPKGSPQAQFEQQCQKHPSACG
jgi:hypothetical protein